MLLSVIIVNYNVRYFLEQCLCSVEKAIGSLQSAPSEQQAQVFVADNNSSDGSVEYLQDKYPFAKFIVNSENVGFAKANNKALQQATGKYILFLNPDTIVPEDGFAKCIEFMEARHEAGALGVYMIDGSGRYLQESKRGFPSAWVSFCKMSGLTGLFPGSKLFARYYLGHLSSQQTHEIDILSGAFMLVRKETLDKTGGFDEQFFMYGEDIDLSYRIQQSGYKNYYFPGCRIIHFKGESTRKDSRYIQLFHKAMIQFVQKHFSGTVSWFYTGLLKMAVWWKTKFRNREPGAGSRDLKGRGTVFICGDGKSMFEIRTCFSNKIITPEKEPAGEIIFCEGASYSFGKIIDEMQLLPTGKRIFIHGQGTNSIVGSHSKNTQGDYVVVLH